MTTTTVHPPTIKQMQYLVALDDEEHFARAAERCAVTQSTLSAGLAEMERLLGIVLIERTRRVVRFTTIGRQVAAQARKVLSETDLLADIVRASGRPLSGDMRLTVIPTIAPFVLPGMVALARRDYPDLRLLLREETSAAACESLQAGRTDCVMLALPYPCGEVEEEHVVDDRIMLAARSDDPILDQGTGWVDRMDPSRLLLLEDGHCLRDHALSACGRPDAVESARMMGTSLHTLVTMVDGGVGVTMIPAMAVASGILDGTDVVARDIESPDAVRRVVLIWRRSGPRDADYRLVADMARSLFSPG